MLNKITDEAKWRHTLWVNSSWPSIEYMEKNALTSRVMYHDDVIRWKHFPRYWPFVQGIHRSPVNSPHNGQWRRALIFSLICAWINGWVNNGEAGDLGCHCTHYNATVMCIANPFFLIACSSRGDKENSTRMQWVNTTSWLYIGSPID